MVAVGKMKSCLAVALAFLLAGALCPVLPAHALADSGDGFQAIDISGFDQLESASSDGVLNGSAGQSTEEGQGLSAASLTATKLDSKNLDDGTYTVEVKLMQATDVKKSSMAKGAIDTTDTPDKLVVKGGSYTLNVALGTVQFGNITGYVNQIDTYSAFSIENPKLVVNGDPKKPWSAKSKKDFGPVLLPVPTSAKDDGYVPIQLYSNEMPVSPQKAVLFIDWSTLAKVSDEVPDSTDQQGGEKEKPTNSDKDNSGKSSNSGNSGKSGNSASSGQSGSSGSSSSSGSSGKSGESGSTTSSSSSSTSSKSKDFETGHVYSVPIYFTKAGTDETSMASQYFGGEAYVRPQSDGTLNVRFATNRSDYIESVTYKGTEATVTSESGNTREYSINIPKSQSDTVIPLSFVVKPMREMGGGPVTADMHLYLSQASDQGSDTGQVATSSGGRTSAPTTGGSPASGSSASGSNSLPGTGDAAMTLAGMLALIVCVAAGSMLLYARKRVR